MRECTFANIVFPVPGGPCIKMFLYIPLFCLVFLVAIAMSRNRSSNAGSKTTPESASVSLFLSFFSASMGCLRVSKNENLDVSRTKDGLP